MPTVCSSQKQPCSMPACCRCNASGRCRGCSCRKSGKPCVDCLPSRLGRCENLPSSDTTVADSISDSPSSSTLHSPDRPDDSGTELPSITACSESVTSHSLPSFPQCHEPAFTWGIVDGASLLIPSPAVTPKLSTGDEMCSKFHQANPEIRSFVS